jgi:hypothetical protein
VVWVWCQLNAIQFRAAELKLQCASSGESRVEWSSEGRVKRVGE